MTSKWSITSEPTEQYYPPTYTLFMLTYIYALLNLSHSYGCECTCCYKWFLAQN